MKRRSLDKDDVPILDKINNVDSNLFSLKKNVKANDILRESNNTQFYIFLHHIEQSRYKKLVVNWLGRQNFG